MWILFEQSLETCSIYEWNLEDLWDDLDLDYDVICLLDYNDL